MEVYGHGPFGARSIVVWDLAYGRDLILHLPGEVKPYGASTGATFACGKDSEQSHATFTLSFSEGSDGVHRCHRCFTKGGRPRQKYKPEGGWLRLMAKPFGSLQ